MVVTGTGNVGINNSNPVSRLHITDSSPQMLLQGGNFAGLHQQYAWNTNMYFGAYYNGSNEVYGATGRGAFKILALHDADNDPQYLAFYGANAGTAGNTITWNTVGFAQDEDGNVGIGTTSPGTKLDVNGVITATGGNSTNWNTAFGWGNHASQGYATQTYVNTAISNLVDAAPGTLDTLNELAAALGDDPNFATTVATSIGTKLPLAGGTMTGQILTPSVNTGVYDGAIQIREQGYVNDTQTAWGYSPAITFHWGNTTVKRFGIRSDGQFAIDDAPLALQSWVTSQGYTTNTGTVTSVSGTGGYGGLTLSGTVTSSGNITLGGTPTGTWPISVSGNAATATSATSATSATQVVTLQDDPPAGVNGKLWWETDTGKLKVYYGASSAWVDALPMPDMTLYLSTAGGAISGDLSIAQTLTVTGNILSSAVITATGGNSTQWNTAFGWGNHASAGYVPGARTITINGTALDLTANRSWTISSITGNAGTATTLQTARTLTIGATGKTFNGSANVSWSLAEIGAADASHTHNVYDLNNFASGADPNTYLQTRIWTSLNGATVGNYPSAYNGVVNLGIDASHGLQFSYHYGATNDALYFRHKSDNPSAPAGAGWQAWQVVASRSWVTAQSYLTSYTETDTLASVTGRGASTNTFTSLLGGSKLVIQNLTNGGNSRGIFMWSSDDSNWGIYMSTAAAGVSLAGGNAVASIDGRTSHHIRFRVYDASGNGFIWENNSEVALMSLTGNTGNLYTRGQIYAGNSTSNVVWHAGNDGSGSGLDADLWDGYHVGQFSNWASRSTNDIVSGMLSWRNYGNSHVIFDASASLSPAGTAINNTNSEVPWAGTYPTLMGWNGASTYGVRVDSARQADVAGNATTLGLWQPQEFIPYHSGSDFVDGTLVVTNIDASVTNGDSFVMEVTGKSYGSGAGPFALLLEGYIYNNTFISVGAISYGGYFPGPVKILNYNGNLAFWWPRGSYWNSFSVTVREAGGSSKNRVTSISNSTEPSSSKKVSITPVQSLHSSNYNSYAPTLTGTGASGTWGINVTGTAGSETLATVTGRGASTSTDLTFNGTLTMGTGGTQYIRMGRFPASITNTGEAWIGRASDRSTGTMTVQLGSDAARIFEIVDHAWSTVILNVGMNSFSYKGNTIWHAGNDGTGSGLDADLLDGENGSYYQPASTAITTSNIGSQSVSYATSAGNSSTTSQRDFNYLSTRELQLGSFKIYNVGAFSAASTQARRFLVGKIGIDYNDWNGVGMFEVEIAEQYYFNGLRKRYIVNYGYGGTNSIQLVEYNGIGANNADVIVDGPVQISGDHYVLSVYVRVRNYGTYAALVKTTRNITSSNPPGIGQAAIFMDSGAENISDFTPDSIVYLTSGQTGIAAPIFYDSDDTNYYVNPNSSSRLSTMQIDRIGVGQAVDNGYRIITSGDIYLNAVGNGWAEGVWKQRRGGSTFYDVIDAGNIGSQSVSYATTAGALTSMNISQFTNDSGYITGYTETNTFLGDGGAGDTHPGTSRLIFTGQLSAGSDVLGMPATDNSNAFLNINRHPGEYNSQLGFSSNGSMYYRSFSAAAINSTQAWRQVWDSGNLTNLNQLTNGPGYITGNQTITLSGDVSGSGTTSIVVTVDNIDGWGFVNTGSNSAVNADTIDSNGITYYTAGVSNFSGNATDGALYSQRYSSVWQHQIAGDYRSGMIAVRGKNNGTWTAWRTIIDSSTIGSQSVNYATSAGSATSATSAGSVPASGITGQTGMWTSAARPGAYRLYRNDDDSAYNVQTTWSSDVSGYWSLRGYLNDTYHAPCYVALAGTANSVAWTNVSGRPTAVSSFTNDSGYLTASGTIANATSATQVVTIQDDPPAGVNGKLWWESDTGKLKVYYGTSSAWVDATPVPDMSLYYAKAGGPISGDVTIQQTLTVVGNTLIQGTLTETSDISLKENILPLESSLDKVMKLNGVSFNKKATPNVKEIGFIAQEVEAVIPDLVTETNEGIKTVSYSRVTAVLVETIKEQQAQIEELKNMVNMLAEKLNNL
jgi:hypothetical protein